MESPSASAVTGLFLRRTWPESFGPSFPADGPGRCVARRCCRDVPRDRARFPANNAARIPREAPPRRAVTPTAKSTAVAPAAAHDGLPRRLSARPPDPTAHDPARSRPGIGGSRHVPTPAQNDSPCTLRPCPTRPARPGLGRNSLDWDGLGRCGSGTIPNPRPARNDSPRTLRPRPARPGQAGLGDGRPGNGRSLSPAGPARDDSSRPVRVRRAAVRQVSGARGGRCQGAARPARNVGSGPCVPDPPVRTWGLGGGCGGAATRAAQPLSPHEQAFILCGYRPVGMAFCRPNASIGGRC